MGFSNTLSTALLVRAPKIRRQALRCRGTTAEFMGQDKGKYIALQDEKYTSVSIPSSDREKSMAAATHKVVPHPKLKRDYKGKRVRTLKELQNGWGIIPAGAIATIDYQGPKGSSLTIDPCNCCGVKAVISGIQSGDIEFIE
jgi:hypothetical protein